MSAPTTGIKDVATLAGVSVGTVSNVLNRPERVSESTRSKVQQAITDLGFVRNESGRQLRAGRSRMIAYLGLAVTNPFFTDVARGIEEVARSHGLAVFLGNSDRDPSREAEYLEMLLEQRVRGVIVSPFAELTQQFLQPTGARGRRWPSSARRWGRTGAARPSTTSSAARWRSTICSSRATGTSPSSAARCTPGVWPTGWSAPVEALAERRPRSGCR